MAQGAGYKVQGAREMAQVAGCRFQGNTTAHAHLLCIFMAIFNDEIKHRYDTLIKKINRYMQWAIQNLNEFP